jgi:hypothetical protein
MGQVYQCWWRVYREINVYTRFEHGIFYVLYPFVTYLLTVPRTRSYFLYSCKVAYVAVMYPRRRLRQKTAKPTPTQKLGCGLDNRVIGVRLRARVRDFSFLRSLHTSSGAHPTFPRGVGAKWQGIEADHLFPSNVVEVTSTRVFMGQCLIPSYVCMFLTTDLTAIRLSFSTIRRSISCPVSISVSGCLHIRKIG